MGISDEGSFERPTPRERKSSTFPMRSKANLTPEERLKRKINFYKLSLGIIAAIFGAGFMLAREVGAFATKDGVKTTLTESTTKHAETHKVVDDKIDRLDRRTVKMYGEQRAAAVRQELLQANVDLLVEAIEHPNNGITRSSRATRRRMKAEIVQKKKRLKEIEADPLQGLDDL